LPERGTPWGYPARTESWLRLWKDTKWGALRKQFIDQTDGQENLRKAVSSCTRPQMGGGKTKGGTGANEKGEQPRNIFNCRLKRVKKVAVPDG